MTSAYITLLTNERYLPGVLNLGKSIKKYDTKHPLAILVDTKSISEESLHFISQVFDDVIDVKDQLLYSSVDKVKELLGRPELAVTLTKIVLWDLSQYETLIYLDADTLPIASLDNLFVDFAPAHNEVVASPDAGWPDIFNSGVMILKPSSDTFKELSEFVKKTESFDGADQGVLNEFFNIGKSAFWKRLPFIYNVTPNSLYQYSPAYTRFAKDIKLVHYIGDLKPWYKTSFEFASSDVHRLWWESFQSHYPQDLAAKILNKKGEAYNLTFDKLTNVWESNETDIPILSKDVDDIKIESLPPVFPWEEREYREPTRVFTEESEIPSQFSNLNI